MSHAVSLLEGLDHLVVQDILLTKTAELADVVLPATAAWCEAEGTVTNSERRVQRVRKALEPPAGARDDIEILLEIAARLGHEWKYASSEAMRMSVATARQNPPPIAAPLIAPMTGWCILRIAMITSSRSSSARRAIDVTVKPPTFGTMPESSRSAPEQNP